MNEKYIPERDAREIMRLAPKSKGVTQVTLAGRLGIGQNALSQSVNRSRMSLQNFMRVLNALDYDVVIVDRESGEAKWKVEPELLAEPDDI